VRENWYRGQRGSLKTGKRCRNVPLDRELWEALAALIARSPYRDDPEAPLFASRNGTPVDAHNIANRVFRPLGKKLGFPITWHAFRRAHSSFTGELSDLPIEDRIATMGHADARMTLYYSQADMDRRRRIPEEIMRRLRAEEVPPEGLAEMDTKGGVQ
jgi:integrase